MVEMRRGPPHHRCQSNRGCRSARGHGPGNPRSRPDKHPEAISNLFLFRPILWKPLKSPASRLKTPSEDRLQTGGNTCWTALNSFLSGMNCQSEKSRAKQLDTVILAVGANPLIYTQIMKQSCLVLQEGQIRHLTFVGVGVNY